MKKSDLVDAIAGRAGISKSHAQSIVEDVFELITEALSKGDDVDLRGFGSFFVREVAAQNDRPARKAPDFKPAKELRNRVDPDDEK